MSSEIPTRKRRKDGKRPKPAPLQGPQLQRKMAATQEKRRQALELRKQGATYEQIARAMQLSTPMVAWRYVQDALKDIPIEVAKEVKLLEIEACRDDMRRVNERIAGGKLSLVEFVKAIGAKVKLREQLARYLGLYAPTDHTHTFLNRHVDVNALTDEQIERALAGDLGVLAEAPAAASARAGAAAPGEPGGADRVARTAH